MRLPTVVDSLRVFKENFSKQISSVIDIGAQTGTYFLMSEFKNAKHYLFEPVHIYHDILKTNYEKAGISYELFDYAVSDSSGIMYQHWLSIDLSGNVTHSQLLPQKCPEWFGEKLVKIVETKVITLDEWAQNKKVEEPYLVKIDVDGIEEKIIDGGAETLKNATLVIIEAGIPSLVTRAQKLQNLGLILFDICDLCYYFEQFSQCDLVFINKDVVKNNINFRPWEKTGGIVVWEKWEVLTCYLLSFQNKGGQKT